MTRRQLLQPEPSKRVLGALEVCFNIIQFFNSCTLGNEQEDSIVQLIQCLNASELHHFLGSGSKSLWGEIFITWLELHLCCFQEKSLTMSARSSVHAGVFPLVQKQNTTVSSSEHPSCYLRHRYFSIFIT